MAQKGSRKERGISRKERTGDRKEREGVRKERKGWMRWYRAPNRVTTV
jgi:hypothetical protein